MALAPGVPITEAAEVESRKLQRHFGRFDILFFLICTIVGVDTIASVASSGGEAFTWMIVFAVVFFIPQALLFAELGTAFPQEGGPYLWARLAFGHLAGAINNFLYWVTNPVWLGGTLAFSMITAIEVFFNNGNDFSTPWFFVITLIFIWIAVLAAILSLSSGKWLPTAGAFARFLLLGFFTIAVIIYGGKPGGHALSAGNFNPRGAGCRALAVSGYDGAAPRFLGVINARFGTPVRVNIFSGIMATVVLILAHQLTNGNAAKFFGAVLGVTISTTLVSYLLIYPALWKLRRSHPEVARPFKMPWYQPLTVILMVLLIITVIELFAPGAGMHWFSSDFAPEGWTHGERWTYLATEVVPVLVFVLIGVLFWRMGKKTREETVRLAPANASAAETDADPDSSMA